MFVLFLFIWYNFCMRKYIFIIILFFSSCSFVYGREEVSYYGCVDGDTIKVMYNGQVVKVRLLAVDTPESVKSGSEIEYYGIEASKYTCNMIKDASKLELEFDPNSDRYDKYNRLLAWVYVDGYLLQELLIENGYASVAYLYDDYMYTDRLLIKEEKAKENNIGIWYKEDGNDYKNEVKVSSIILVIIIGLFLGILWVNIYLSKKS